MHVNATTTFPWGRPGASEAADTAYALLDGVWLAPVGIALLDRDLRFVQVNETFARLGGLPAPAYAGKTPGEVFAADPELVAGAEERLRAVVQSGRPVRDVAASCRAPDGELRSWRASLYPVLGPGDQVRGVCVVGDETTHLHDREVALERARAAADAAARRLALLQRLTAALSTAVAPADVAAAVAEHVRAASGARAVSLRLLAEEGLVALAVEGLQMPEAYGGRVVPRDAAHPLADAVRSGQGVWIESLDALAARYSQLLELYRGGGHEASAGLPLRAGGRTLGALGLLFAEPRSFDLEERAFLVSIAEQCGQALERALLFERERTLRAAAERDRALLDGLFENAPLGIALLDRDLRFVRVNPMLARINGAPAEAHVGRTPPEVATLVGWEEIGSGLRQVVATGVPRLDAPVSISGPGGRDRHLLEAWYPVRAGEETVGVAAIIREVTAERDAQDFQRNVLGIVGHDVRTPLATIGTAAHLLRSVEPLTDRQGRLVARIASGAARIERVVSLLVDYAQAHAGQALPVRPRPCDLAALCRSAADECEGARPGRRIRCAGEGDATGEWDADRLGQAIGNLLSNAIDHSPPETPVHVRWRGGADAVELEIENEAPPIPTEALARMFEPFQRGKRDASERRGLGLGLFIARAIAQAHAGRISARSEGGRIAFTMRLPRTARPPRA